MSKRSFKKQAGDTIIEVLLAMTVIGLSLGVAYGIANRSARIGRQAQERTEATKLAESQLELMKGYLNNNTVPRSSYQDANFYCVVESNPKINISSGIDPDIAQCFEIDGLYDLRIEYTLGPSGTDVFRSVVLWDDPSRTVTGVEDTRNKVEISYRP